MKVSTKPGSLKARSIWKNIFEIPFNQSLLSTDSYTEDLTKEEALAKVDIHPFNHRSFSRGIPKTFRNP